MRYGTIITRTIARTLLLAVLICAMGIALVTVGHLLWPETAPSAMAYPLRSGGPARLTGAVGTWRGDLPRARSIDVVREIEVAGLEAPQDGVWAGQYDPVTGGIEIINGAADVTLAHEYGHALMHDLIVRHVGEGAPALALFERLADADRQTDPSVVPAWLRPMFAEYRDLPADPFGDTYYGDSFGEYFAESFAWTAVRGGMDVAPAALGFFSGIEREAARPAR